MSDGPRVVASAKNCPGRKELIFDNWSWSVREYTDEEGCVADYSVEPKQAKAFCDKWLSDDEK